MVGISNPVWPLAQAPKPWTAGGSFGASRDGGSRRHQGIDLGAPKGTPVIASEDGVITAVQGWSGPQTKGLLVYSPATDITILYGAVAPNSYPPVGTQVKRGEQIASLGVYPAGSSMLHIELWPGKLKPPRPRWNPGEPAPSIDPAEYLNRAAEIWTLIPGKLPQDDPGQQAPSPNKPSSGGGGGGAALIVAAVAGLYFFSR